MMTVRSRVPSPPVLGVMRQRDRGLNRVEAVHPQPQAQPPGAASPVQAAVPGGIAREDWLALFDAVAERLQQLAGGGIVPASGLAPGLRLQDCVVALRQLRPGPADGPQGGDTRPGAGPPLTPQGARVAGPDIPATRDTPDVPDKPDIPEIPDPPATPDGP